MLSRMLMAMLSSAAAQFVAHRDDAWRSDTFVMGAIDSRSHVMQ
jgi:hypothetical protein